MIEFGLFVRACAHGRPVQVHLLTCGWMAPPPERGPGEGCPDINGILCANAEDLSPHQLRKRGWRKDRRHGWVCPSCVARMRGD